MTNDIVTAALGVLAPLTPYLVRGASLAGEEVVKAIGTAGGTAAWEMAQKAWSRITGSATGAGPVNNAAALLSADPGETVYRDALAKSLAKMLADHPQLAEEIVGDLGGSDSVQRMFAETGGSITDAHQQLSGAGEQVMVSRRGGSISTASQSRSD